MKNFFLSKRAEELFPPARTDSKRALKDENAKKVR
jgi:hypothetical protein